MPIITSYPDIEKLVAAGQPENHAYCFCKWNELDTDNTRKIEQLSIKISAMANANGGYMIFGIEPLRKRAKKIVPNTQPIHIDKLQYLVETTISPAIDDLQILSLSADNAPYSTVLVIRIPDSNNAPHMAADKHFYKRVDVKEYMLEEYEIRELYHRSKKSDIDLFGIINTGGIPTLQQGLFEVVNFYPRFLVKNISSVIEKDYKIEIYIPSALHNPNFDILQKHFSRMEEHYSIFAITNDSPLYQDELATIVEANLFVNTYNYKYFDDMYIYIKLFYSNGVKSKAFKIKETFLYKNTIITQADFTAPEIFITE